VGQKTCGTRLYGNMPLCLQEYSNGYKISYYNDTGEVGHLDFNLNCSSGRYGDEGDFIAQPGWTYSYFFAVGVKSWCQGGMYDYDMNYWHWTRTLSG
jgi:hypothetical protein